MVTQLPDPLEHARAGLLADVAVVSKSLRNRHQRHAEIVGNILHPNGHGLERASTLELPPE
jgi:hypothetical protein